MKFTTYTLRYNRNYWVKLDGLAQAGIDVSGRIALQGPINADNRRYLTAKATRAGHKLDHLATTLAEGGPLGGDRERGDGRLPELTDRVGRDRDQGRLA